jgi:hypothetical protein
VPGKLLHEPDAVFAKVLWANRGLGSDPAPWAAYVFGKGTAPTTTWPVFDGGEPHEPDECLVVHETAPQVDARIQVTGETQLKHGFAVTVRGITKRRARNKAEELRWDFDRLFLDQTVTLDGQQYLIPSVLVRSVIPFGKATSPRGIGLWMVNVNVLANVLAYPIQG